MMPSLDNLITHDTIRMWRRYQAEELAALLAEVRDDLVAHLGLDPAHPLATVAALAVTRLMRFDLHVYGVQYEIQRDVAERQARRMLDRLQLDPHTFEPLARLDTEATLSWLARLTEEPHE